MSTNWSNEELLAYILIYCSMADFHIDASEKEYLITRFSEPLYKKMLAILDQDSEEVRKHKIKEAYDDHIYNNNETDVIYEEIHNLFTIDGEFDSLEKKLLKQLDSILSN